MRLPLLKGIAASLCAPLRSPLALSPVPDTLHEAVQGGAHTYATALLRRHGQLLKVAHRGIDTRAVLRGWFGAVSAASVAVRSPSSSTAHGGSADCNFYCYRRCRCCSCCSPPSCSALCTSVRRGSTATTTTPLHPTSSKSAPSLPTTVLDGAQEPRAPTSAGARGDMMEELEAAVMACVPRAPLCVKASFVYQLLVHHYDPNNVLWAPWGQEKERNSNNNNNNSGKKKKSVSRQSRNDALGSYMRATCGSVKGLLMRMACACDPTATTASASPADHGEGRKAVVEARGGDAVHAGAFHVYLSCDQTFVTAAASLHEAGEAFSRYYQPLTTQDIATLNLTPLATAAKGTSPTERSERSDVYTSTATTTEAVAAEVLEKGQLRFEDYCHPIFPAGAPSSKAAATAQARAVHRSRVIAQLLRPSSTRTGESLVEVYMPYFGEDFVPPPPPSSSSPSAASPERTASPAVTAAATTTTTTKSRTLQPSLGGPKSAFSAEQVGELLPTYFVPVDALFAQLPPGYTTAHVRAIFGETGAVEIVALGQETFVRFHGGISGSGYSAAVLQRQLGPFSVVQGGERYTEESSNSNSNSNKEAAGDEDGVNRYITSFAPDPYLLHAFLPRLARPFEWVSLYDLVQHAPATVREALLPLREQQTLLYFAQQQHRVQFAPQRGGAVARHLPPTRTLRAETTPLPAVLADVSRTLESRGALYVEDLERDAGCVLSDHAKRAIIAYFGTLRRFLFQHEPWFRLSVLKSPVTVFEEQAHTASLATTTTATAAATAAAPAAPRTQEEETDASLPPLPATLPRPGQGFMSVPLPSNGSAAADAADVVAAAAAAQLDADGFPRWLTSRDLVVQLEREARIRDNSAATTLGQLEMAALSKNKTRKLRRRRAADENPDSPYSDPALLLDAVVRYLPPTRHVCLRALLQSLPSSMSDFLPNDPVRMFLNAPDKVQLFEFRTRNHLRVTRAGNPLPDGRLRSTYTEEEIVYLTAAQLAPGQVKNSMHLFGDLPFWGREALRLHYGHLNQVLERYPEHFVLVYQGTGSARTQMARVSLLRPLPPPSTLAEAEAGGAALSSDDMAAIVKADQELLMAEMAPELRAALR